MRARRMELGGYLPARRRKADAAGGAASSPRSSASSRAPRSARSRPRWRSCRSCRRCCATRRSASTSCRSCPTSRARSAWKACSASSASGTSSGQLYTPQDADQLMFYKEGKDGQILQEGINEAGAMCDWIAAATSYSTHGVPMIPFYIFYSMFGFQRVGDLAWAAGDMRARGFLLGGTAGRTTLNGEGLQHEDGHSHLISATVPNCISYDPTFGYEVAVIVQDGLRRMCRGAGGRLLLHDGDERELHAAGDAGGRGRRTSSRACTCAARATSEDQGAARAAAGLGHDTARGDRRGRTAARSTGASSRTSGAARRSPSSHATATRSTRWNTAQPDREAAASSHVETCLGARRPGDRRDRLRARLRRADPRVRAAALRGARHRRLRPLRHAREAAQLLRGGPALHDRGGVEGARRRRAMPAAKVADAIAKYGIDPAKPAPWTV